MRRMKSGPHRRQTQTISQATTAAMASQKSRLTKPLRRDTGGKSLCPLIRASVAAINAPIQVTGWPIRR